MVPGLGQGWRLARGQVAGLGQGLGQGLRVGLGPLGLLGLGVAKGQRGLGLGVKVAL